jgi:tRNA A37 threonylcarbamoyladenosine dehydratase
MPSRSSTSNEDLTQFSRTIDLLGEEGFDRIRRSFVVVVGLGGVGSHAAVGLARAGVGRLRLVDFDTISATSLNRHAVALPEHVGRPKTRVLAEILERLHPSIEVETEESFFHDETAEKLLRGDPDLVVDAIDSLNPKVSLLETCVKRGLHVVTSLGASSRTDPGKVRVAPLHQTRGCPLGKALRKRLRRRGVDLSPITAVHSIEKPGPTLPPDDGEGWYGEGRRRNRLPSLSTLPGVFGYAAANAAILTLARYISAE